LRETAAGDDRKKRIGLNPLPDLARLGANAGPIFSRFRRPKWPKWRIEMPAALGEQRPLSKVV
jgi:hypothetical protein